MGRVTNRPRGVVPSLRAVRLAGLGPRPEAICEPTANRVHKLAVWVGSEEGAETLDTDGSGDAEEVGVGSDGPEGCSVGGLVQRGVWQGGHGLSRPCQCEARHFGGRPNEIPRPTWSRCPTPAELTSAGQSIRYQCGCCSCTWSRRGRTCRNWWSCNKSRCSSGYRALGGALGTQRQGGPES